MKIKKNGKVINLTESDLKRIVKKVLVETDESGVDCLPQFKGETPIDRIKCCANKKGISEKDLEGLTDLTDLKDFITKKGGEFITCLSGGYMKA